MINIFVDMDSVICDFYSSYPTKVFDKEIFEREVVENKIFEKLDWEPNGKALIAELVNIQENSDGEINIEMLSSLGSTKLDVATEAARHKTKWLKDHGIKFKPNFVMHKGLKKWYASPNSILIDDSAQNIWDFAEHKGSIVLYDSKFFNHHVAILNAVIITLLNKGNIFNGQ